MPRKESWLPLYQGSSMPSLLHASSCACRDDVDHRGRKIDWGKWCVEGWASRPCAWRGRPAGCCTHLAALQWSPRCSKHARQHPACVCCAAASAAVGGQRPTVAVPEGKLPVCKLRARPRHPAQPGLSPAMTSSCTFGLRMTVYLLCACPGRRAITSNDPDFHGEGNPDTGEDYAAGPGERAGSGWAGLAGGRRPHSFSAQGWHGGHQRDWQCAG